MFGVLLLFRFVTLAERYRVVELAPAGGAALRHRVETPGEYTCTPFPLQYVVRVTDGEQMWRRSELGDDPAGHTDLAVRAAGT